MAELGGELQTLGLDDWRLRLEKAVSTPGTEIDAGMAIRHTLRELLASKTPLPAEVREIASNLFQELGKALRS
jgi:hypothetical protein